MDTTRGIVELGDIEISLDFDQLEREISGLGDANAEASGYEALEQGMDKHWYRSLVVRKQAERRFNEGISDPEDIDTFHLGEGLNTELAKSYFKLLQLFKESLNQSNCLEAFSEQTKELLTTFNDIFPKMVYESKYQTFLMEHMSRDHRPQGRTNLLLKMTYPEFIACNTNAKQDNIFTAISCHSVGDISNVIPLRVHVLCYLLNNKHFAALNEGPEDTADAIQECLKPRGILNPCLLKACASSLNIRINTFIKSVFVADVHAMLKDLRGTYEPSDSDDEPIALETLAIAGTPVNAKRVIYNTVPLIAREDFDKFQYKKSMDPYYDAFSTVFEIDAREVQAISTKLLGERIANLREIENDQEMCPQHFAIEPTSESSHFEEHVEEPMNPIYEDTLDWPNLTKEQKVQRGFTSIERDRLDQFVAPAKILPVLETFIDEDHEVGQYPLFPLEGDIYICDMDDGQETVHGAFNKPSMGKLYYSYPE